MRRHSLHRSVRVPALLKALVCLFFLPAVTDVQAQSADPAEHLFQRALQTEVVLGDLEGAIVLYERLIRDHPDDRVMAVRALLRIGACYEKTGDARAVEAYERAFRGYPDIPDHWERARERYLALVGGAPMGQTDPLGRRHLLTLPSWAAAPSMSPDAAFLVYTDVRTGDLERLDLADRKRTRLTFEGGLEPGGSGAVALAPRVHPDGGRIVYARLDADGASTLHSVATDGSARTKALYDPGPDAYTEPGVWVPDGSGFYGFRLARATLEGSILFFPEGEQPRRVGPIMIGSPPLSMLFHDGLNTLYYDPTQDLREYLGDVWRLDFDSGASSRVGWSTDHDHLLACDAEGRYVVVWSQEDRPGGIYVIPPAGDEMTFVPRTLTPFPSRVFPLGVYRDSFYYTEEAGLSDQVADSDWEGVPGVWVRRWAEYRSAEEIGHPGMDYGPPDRFAWSRAGTLVHKSLFGGNELALTRSRVPGPRIEPVVDLTSEILLSARHSPKTHAAFSPDASQVAWLEPPDAIHWFESGWRLVLRDLASSRVWESELPFEPSGSFLVWADEGALLVAGREASGEEGLYRVSSADGTSRRVHACGWRDLYAPVPIEGGILALERAGPPGVGGVRLISPADEATRYVVRSLYESPDRLAGLAVSPSGDHAAVAAVATSAEAAARTLRIRVISLSAAPGDREVGHIPSDGTIASFRWLLDGRRIELVTGSPGCREHSGCVQGWLLETDAADPMPLRLSHENAWSTAVISRDGTARIQTRVDPRRRTEIWVMESLFDLVERLYPDLAGGIR